MPERPLPTEAEVRGYIRDRRNWGRWGKDDQVGALNLVTPAKRVAATRLVRSGRSVSLSRPFPKEPGLNNALPAQHYMRIVPRGKGKVKILARGDVGKALTVRAHKFSGKAAEKIAAAGGATEQLA